MASKWARRVLVAACALFTWALDGCSTTPNQAPVEVRTNVHSRGVHGAGAAAERGTPGSEGAESNGDTRSPTYTVKPGDTLMRIALDSGQSWRDIARWNNIDNPNVIEVGQVLRVVAPPGDVAPAPGAASAPAGGFKPLPAASAAGRTELKPIEAHPASGAAAAAAASGAASGVPMAGVAPPSQPARLANDDLTWSWPAAGPVIAAFDPTHTKGVSIGGKAGDPVYAAADGRVVYAGSGLRGYGNLVIVKHNADYLTAYAHNQVLLVKEDQIVKRGQKIAEMGSTDSDRVQLHFEIRRQGKPVDPLKLLPAR